MSLFDLDQSSGLYEGWIKTGQCEVRLFTYPNTDKTTVALIVPYVTETGEQFDTPEMFSVGSPDKWQPEAGKVNAVNIIDPSRNFHAQSGVGRCLTLLSDVPAFVDFAEKQYPNIGLDIFSNQEFLLKREPVLGKDGQPVLNAKGQPKTSVVLANWRPGGQIQHTVSPNGASGVAGTAQPAAPAPATNPVQQQAVVTPEVEALIVQAITAGKAKASEIAMHVAQTAPMQLGNVQKAMNDTVWLMAPERMFAYEASTQTFSAK